MTIKTRALALAAAAGLTLTAGLAVAGTASGATPSCGSGCIDVFSHKFGTHRTPAFVLDVLRQGAHVGQPIILFQPSNSDPAEDFTVSLQGSTADFYASGLVSPALALRYGCTVGPNRFQFANCANSVNDPAIELEYSPDGRDTGLCVGVALNATVNEGVTLQGCGISARTTWIIDTNDSPATLAHGYVPLINGSGSNFSHPYVLTYPSNGNPNDKPRPQLTVRNLTGFSNGIGSPIGSVLDNQLWGADFGVLR